MDKNRRNKRNWNNQNRNNQNRNSDNRYDSYDNRSDGRNDNRNTDYRNDNRFSDNKAKTFQFNRSAYEDVNAEKERQTAIQKMKEKHVICPKCGQPITDIASSLNDKVSGQPVHFDCVFSEISKKEVLGQNEKIAYIGQGRFGVLYFENPRDQRHFTIKKIIEWEDREQKPGWRDEISSLYSQVN